MAAVEIKGSRETKETGKVKTAVLLEVSAAADGSKAIGAFWLTESAPTGRVAVHKVITPEWLPGVFLITTQFQGPVAY